ncbi:hypothetical protein Mgra_00008252 [Meloidogyne graminicola]|uniref:Uncharacterized protein n=1 Tax=Meloidogyne graminicola TaxID=189291 RepID=A0A8S9ZG94_9BILA|nr:hypothetical protein Mgra_00008252 [Meloidogyne graminicola]
MLTRKELIAMRLYEFITSNNNKLSQTTKDRLSNQETRDSLIASLVDGTVFSILESLSDLQNLKEREFWDQREKKIKQLKDSGIYTDQRKRDIDKGILEGIDETVREQQNMLICAGLPQPLFKQSLDSEEIHLQMFIIQFILTLKDVYEDQQG